MTYSTRRTRANLLVRVALGLALPLCWANSAGAYSLQEAEWLCYRGNYSFWNTGDCDSTACSYSDVPFYRLCSTSYTSDETAALSWAFWAWARAYTSTIRLYWNQPYCTTSGEDWYDDGNEINEFNAQETGTLLGVEGTDYVSCNPVVLPYKTVIASDIKLDDDISAVSQNSLAECLSSACSLELVLEHELGHSYQLDHFNSWAAIMHSTECFHSCNVGQGLRSEPLADDMQGLLRLHGRNWTSKKNLGGMPFYKNAGGSWVVSTGFATNCGESRDITFTYLNYYQALGSYNFKVRLALVPSSVASPTSADVQWWGSVVTWSAGQSGATYPVTMTGAPPASALQDGVNYRYWLLVDPLSNHVELDEGDNWIPTSYILQGEAPSNC